VGFGVLLHLESNLCYKLPTGDTKTRYTTHVAAHENWTDAPMTITFAEINGAPERYIPSPSVRS
jgi:hypothetical protein